MRFVLSAFSLFLALCAALVLDGSFDDEGAVRLAEQAIAGALLAVAGLQAFGAWLAGGRRA